MEEFSRAQGFVFRFLIDFSLIQGCDRLCAIELGLCTSTSIVRVESGNLDAADGIQMARRWRHSQFLTWGRLEAAPPAGSRSLGRAYGSLCPDAIGIPSATSVGRPRP